MSHGHFAGHDETRARAFLEIANDDTTDAVWFARGGYGSCRMIKAYARVEGASRRKTYVGYSDSARCLPLCMGWVPRPWRMVRWCRTFSRWW